MNSMKILTLISKKYGVEYTINLGLMLMCYMNSSVDRYGFKIVYNTSVAPIEDYIILGSLEEYPTLYEDCHNLQMEIHKFLASNKTAVILTDEDFCEEFNLKQQEISHL